jgi:hypothetical protein
VNDAAVGRTGGEGLLLLIDPGIDISKILATLRNSSLVILVHPESEVRPSEDLRVNDSLARSVRLHLLLKSSDVRDGVGGGSSGGSHSSNDANGDMQMLDTLCTLRPIYILHTVTALPPTRPRTQALHRKVIGCSTSLQLLAGTVLGGGYPVV